MIDAHVHIWDPTVFAYPWLDGAGDRAAPHLPADLDRCDGETTGMIFVEAGNALGQAIDEVRWVRGLRRVWPSVREWRADPHAVEAGAARTFYKLREKDGRGGDGDGR
ncbi:hypothetical protein [Microbacterium sp. NPDC056052]|uniref:hypothetical protein n=1 Tax=Microbacterium sp. NPDC056052 TaxID=3345695 RepID=UPI0035D58168